MRFRTHQQDARSATRRLLLLFVLLLAGLVAAVNAVAFAIWWLLPGDGLPALFFECNTGLVLLFVLGGTLVETSRLRRGGGEHVAEWAGGRELLDPRDAHERRLVNVVDEMAVASGLPRPRVYLLDREDAINAFASGWTADDAVVAVTRGAIDCLTRDELQGLVAHEFGHIQQDDLRLNMVLLALVYGLSLVHGYGASLMSENEEGHRALPGVLIGAAFVAAGSVGWLAGQVLQAAVSRQREWLADACAVQFTRSRDGLGGTLRKVWFQVRQGDDRLRRVPAQMLSAMLLQAPKGWVASHPPLPERLRRLYGYAVEPLAVGRLAVDPGEESRPLMAFGAMAGVAPMTSVAPRAPGAAYAAPMSEPAPPPAAPVPPPPAVAVVPGAPAQPSDDEREAFERLHRLHGPGELRAAVLALVVTPGSHRESRAWRDETRGLVAGKAVGADIERLTRAARLPWLDVLLDRLAPAPLADRQALVEAVRRIMAADGLIRPIDRLTWLALRRRLTPRPVTSPRGEVAHELSELSAPLREQMARLTAFLSRLVPGAHHPQAGAAWCQAAARHWLPDGEPPPTCEPPDADGLANAFVDVQTLPWMLRPVLVRAWIDEALPLNPPGRWDDDAADALRLAGYLLDCPLPPELARHYVDVSRR